jgi:hypothetical protein
MDIKALLLEVKPLNIPIRKYREAAKEQGLPQYGHEFYDMVESREALISSKISSFLTPLLTATEKQAGQQDQNLCVSCPVLPSSQKIKNEVQGQ